MRTKAVATEGSDPLKAVADAMVAAVETAEDGVNRARATAADVIPAAGQFLSRAVYKTSYAVSYGVVLPLAMIAVWVPKDNAAVHGLIDGARAAMDAVRGTKSEAVS